MSSSPNKRPESVPFLDLSKILNHKGPHNRIGNPNVQIKIKKIIKQDSESYNQPNELRTQK
jgi:type IV secretory pathway TrbF-like protein